MSDLPPKNTPSPTGVFFTASRPTTEPISWKEYLGKFYDTTPVGTAPNSAKGSPAASINGDAEKAAISLEDEDKALAHYIVPALEKGVKTARLSQSWWIRFRVWYNPYRMVSGHALFSRPSSNTCVQNFTVAFTLNMIGLLIACLNKFPYADKHGAALALGNFTASVACRNEFFLRYFLFYPVVFVFQKVGSSSACSTS